MSKWIVRVTELRNDKFCNGCSELTEAFRCGINPGRWFCNHAESSNRELKTDFEDDSRVMRPPNCPLLTIRQAFGFS